MSLSVGSRLEAYEITGRVGAGGMGEVFRARDTRIGRDVAIKVLPSGVTADGERLRRFEQEARAAGALNDPNLVTVYAVGVHEGAPYLVMELLEGETLREKLGGARHEHLPLRKAMEYAHQLASGLAAAHDKGIVHRDLKPENVFITRDGRVKILDFGLAKLAVGGGGDADDETQARATSPGTVMGTVGYMSPEQVRGQEVDHRTDIFSFGVVLYEMLSGRPAFRGSSAADTMSAILNEDPPELSSSFHVPPPVERVIRRCMEKEKTQRFESARDLAFALDAVSVSGISHETLPPAESGRGPRRWLVVAAAALGASVLVAGATWLGRRTAPAAPAVPTATFTQLTFDRGVESTPALAPDGKTFVFVKGSSPGRQLFLQRVNGQSAIALSQSAGHDDHDPEFSPDGSQIVFRSERDGGGIFVMGATGESVRRITTTGYNPSWSPDGREIIFASEELDTPTSRNSRSSLSIADVASGSVRPLFAGDAMQPHFSPNGKRIVFWGLKARTAQRDILTVAASGDPKTVVMATNDVALDWDAVWAPDGRSILFSSDRGGPMNLWRLPIDEESGRPLGPPQPLGVPAVGAGRISVSRDGRSVAYAASATTQELHHARYDDAAGRITSGPEPVLSGTRLVRNVTPSPDGQWIAVSTERPEDVYVMKTDGSEVRQLTNDVYRDRGVAWTHDSTRVVFYSTRGGDYDAWSIRIDGSALTQLTRGLGPNFPLVAPDGRRMAYYSLDDGTSRIADLTTTPALKAEALPRMPSGEGLYVLGWSPDGTRLIGTEWLQRKNLYLYSLADRSYRAITFAQLAGRKEPWTLLASSAKWIDGRRVLIGPIGSDILALDVDSGQARRVGVAAAVVSISEGARFVVLGRRDVQEDVWLATLGDDRAEK